MFPGLAAAVKRSTLLEIPADEVPLEFIRQFEELLVEAAFSRRRRGGTGYIATPRSVSIKSCWEYLMNVRGREVQAGLKEKALKALLDAGGFKSIEDMNAELDRYAVTSRVPEARQICQKARQLLKNQDSVSGKST